MLDPSWTQSCLPLLQPSEEPGPISSVPTSQVQNTAPGYCPVSEGGDRIGPGNQSDVEGAKNGPSVGPRTRSVPFFPQESPVTPSPRQTNLRWWVLGVAPNRERWQRCQSQEEAECEGQGNKVSPRKTRGQF